MKLTKQNTQLLLVSFVSLFLELLVIRLIGTEIRIFAYLSNLVLLATFIGLGLGMITRRSFSLVLSALSLFLVVILTSSYYIVRWPTLEFRFFSGITELLAPLSESYIWFQPNTYSKSGILIGFFLLFCLFILLVTVFLPLGQMLGSLLKNHKRPLLAYSVNIVASIIGMWVFQLFSLARLSPYLGIVVVLASYTFFVKNQLEKMVVLLLTVVLIAFIVPKAKSETIAYWSPYQKLSLSLITHEKPKTKLEEALPKPSGWYLEVNNVGYMGLLNLSNEYHASVAASLNGFTNDRGFIDDFLLSDQYTLPFVFKPKPRNVLIIGAGGGNDVAAAVRVGESLHNEELTIDAVEIDPTIIEIGKKYHNEDPYSQRNVNAIVDDGRAFMQKTAKKYDLIIMGLADSHTLSSSLTNLRLDHYLYTKEALARVKELLTDDGLFFLTFEVTRPWIGQRIAKSLSDAFGEKPTIFEVRSGGVFGWGGVFFVAGKNKDILPAVLAENKTLGLYVKEHTKVFNTSINSLTDDWPYVYLDKPRFPLIHIVTALVLGGGIFLLRKRLLGQGTFHIACFFWGTAFLLFEFQNISKSSLLFGTTWVTNLFTISAILCLLLLANWVSHKKLFPVTFAFVLLVATVVLQLIIPLHIFNAWGLPQKVFFASLLLNLPLFFGGIIFAHMFASARNKAFAFGSNFLGSVFGGFLEVVSFATGIHALLYLVILFYALGFFFLRFTKADI